MSSHLRAIIASLPLLLPATGCVHNSEARPDQPPSETGQSAVSAAEASADAVEILGSLPPREDLIRVGEVECGRFGNWGAGPLGNVGECRADLRAQARQQGASVVVLVTQQVGIGACLDCIYFYGSAYRRAGAEPKAEAPATTPDAATSPQATGN